MQSLEVSKIRGKNKKNFETCWLSIINKGNFSKFFLFFPIIFENSSDCAICKEKFPKCDHRFGNTFTFYTDIPFAVHFNYAEKILHLHDNCADSFYLSLKNNSHFHIILWFL